MQSNILLKLVAEPSAALASPVRYGDRKDCIVYGTRASGDIQFGAPAEVIKSLMVSGVGVPQTLVLTADFVRSGALMNEVEFVIYHNVFFQKRKLRVVGTPEQLEAVRAIMQESFFGPKPEEVAAQYPSESSQEGLGYFRKELDYFRGGLIFVLEKLMGVQRVAGAGLPTLDEFIEFVPCSESGSVKFSRGQVTDPAATDFDVLLTQPERGKYVLYDQQTGASTLVDTNLFVPEEKPLTFFSERKLEPPSFGRTILGRSHGFDPQKRTTSMVLWADGRGILVDPLADPKGSLHQYGITEDQVPFIFLTHVHADHDAGTLRLILNGQRIRLMTSRVIYESFARKVRAMGVDVDQYVDFIEVTPGHIFDGRRIGMPNLRLDISSAFHSVPCIRFVARYLRNGAQKSYFYSADTFFNPEEYPKLVERGVLSSERARKLLGFGWDADFIDHEAGIPPIHTPQAVLQAQSGKIGKPITMVHTARVEDGITLPIAEEGDTLTIVPREADYASRIYQALAGNRFLRLMSLAFAEKIVRTGVLRTFAPGNEIIREGDSGEDFYCVVSGRVAVKKGGKTVAVLGDNDFFGEEALMTGKRRGASVEALGQTVTVQIPRTRFQQLLKEFPEIARAMERTIRLRPVLSRVAILKILPSARILALAQRLREIVYPRGEEIIIQGDIGDRFFILMEGEVDVLVDRGREQPDLVARLGTGDVFGEMALLGDRIRTATIRAASEQVRVLALAEADFLELVQEVPGVHFALAAMAESRSS